MSQYKLMTSHHPEVIGHMDLCRMYHPSIDFHDYPVVWDQIEINVKYAIAYGALFEVNSKAWTKEGWTSPYPGPEILDLIVSLGGRLALSDDSHSPQAVGSNYAKTREYLLSHEVKEIWHLARIPQEAEPWADPCVQAPKRTGGRSGLQPVRYSGKWWEDSFWGKSANVIEIDRSCLAVI